MEEQFFTDQENNSFENPEPQRPSGLSVACVLSFINAGFQILSNLVWFLSYNAMKEVAESEEYYELMEKFTPNIDQLEDTMQSQLAISRTSYLLMLLLFVASFYGVLQMWKLQKKGFHIYTIAQILMLIVTAIFITSVTDQSIVGSVILTAIWIGIYYIYYKRNMQ